MHSQVVELLPVPQPGNVGDLVRQVVQRVSPLKRKPLHECAVREPRGQPSAVGTVDGVSVVTPNRHSWCQHDGSLDDLQLALQRVVTVEFNWAYRKHTFVVASSEDDSATSSHVAGELMRHAGCVAHEDQVLRRVLSRTINSFKADVTDTGTSSTANAAQVHRTPRARYTSHSA